MYDELFKRPAVRARYRAGPYADARERFLEQARAQGYSRSTLERIAWVLLIVAEAVQRNGGRVSIDQLEKLSRSVRLGNGRRPSEHTAVLLRRFGADWLRGIGSLMSKTDEPTRFARELAAFTEYMRVERGLSPIWTSPVSVESRLLLPDGGMECLFEGCGAGVAQA